MLAAPPPELHKQEMACESQRSIKHLALFAAIQDVEKAKREVESLLYEIKEGKLPPEETVKMPSEDPSIITLASVLENSPMILREYAGDIRGIVSEIREALF